VSHSPTITTYKVAKSCSSVKDTGTGSAASRRRNAAQILPHGNAPPSSTEKLPHSVRNIQKLSSVEEDKKKNQRLVNAPAVCAFNAISL